LDHFAGAFAECLYIKILKITDDVSVHF
jgi:hypothetical protein